MNMEKQAKKFFKSAKSNLSKAKRTYVCRSLKDLIRAYRACTTRSEERALVKKEAAHIRDLFREGDKTFRRRNISKLLFFHMNGYPTDFGMTECIKLCASHEYSDKRVAYLGLMILVDETEEILMLMTNCLKQDLNSAEVQTVSLALNVLGDIANVEMVRDLMPEIEKHLHSKNPYIRKKAALVAVRAVRKLGPEETTNVLGAVPKLFDMKSSAVHLAGSALISALCKQSSDNVPELRVKTGPVLINILREHLHAKRGQSVMGSNPDTVVGGVRNPFLQVKLISTIRQLIETGGTGPFLEDASDALAQVASNTDSGKIAGCAVLYECVRTIIFLNTEQSLRTLAVTILGRFLSHKDATVRYIAMQELTRVVDADGRQAVRNIDEAKVLSGLTEADPSVRKRALELAYRIANQNTVEDIAYQVLKYIKKSKLASDVEDGCYKLFLLSDRYGPSDEWKVEIFVSALSIADVLMPEQLITSFLAMVSTRPGVQAHAVKALYAEALKAKKKAHVQGPEDVFEASRSVPTDDDGERDRDHSRRRLPRLERVATYMLGEYGTSALQAGLSVPDVLDAFEAVLDDSSITDEPWMQQGTVDTNAENELLREVALTGLVKFTFRALNGSSEIFGNKEALQALPTSTGDGANDLSAILGLPAPSKREATDDTGLGTDLLASLGLGDNKPNMALVPVPLEAKSADLSDSMALMSLESDDHDTTDNPVLGRVRRMLLARSRSSSLETQQRASEYLSLLREENHNAFASAMAPMPCLDFDSIQGRARQREAMYSARLNVKANASGGLLLDLLDESPNGAGPAPLPAPPGSELLALPPSKPAPSSVFNLDDIFGSSSASQAQETDVTRSQKVADMSLADIGSGENNKNLPDEDETAVQGDKHAIHSNTIVETDAVSVHATFFRDHPENPSDTRTELLFTNKTTAAMHSFVFLLSVPRYIQLRMRPASSSEIASGESATQSVNLINSLHGRRPIQLKYRVNYSLQGSSSVVQHEGVATGLDVL